MAKTPFKKLILPTTTDSHQSSPSYVLTFVRWANRDTANYDIDQETRKPLIVINDAINITVTDSKSKVTPSATIVLKGGDLNYASIIHPGDYLLINLVDDPQKALNIRDRALALRPINKYTDGFKGLFKIQTVRRQIVTDPATGTKVLNYVVHAFGFTELNTLIYYNPAISKSLAESPAFFISEFKDMFDNISKAGTLEANVQKILILLVKMLLGRGLNKSDLKIPPSQNSHFKVPSGLGPLLNKPKAKVITDIYNFYFGIWKGRAVSNNSNVKIADGFNPNIQKYKQDDSFFEVKGGEATQLQGFKILSFQDLNNKTIWSILSSYLNGAINEMYTTTRVGPDGYTYPTVIFRQKPFNSEHFESPKKLNDGKEKAPADIPHTKFFELPRWKISPNLIYSVDLGFDEAARINFVHLQGRAIAVNSVLNQALQAQNIFFDKDDIERHGLKPAVMSVNFDFPNLTKSKKFANYKAKLWAYLLFDMLYAGHLKESGAMQCVGIEEPICVGDNLEFDGNVYHIESIVHKLGINRDGIKQFRTTVKISFGTSIASDKNRPVYPQMDTPDYIDEVVRTRNEGSYIAPGFSETQDLPNDRNRKNGEMIGKTPSKGYTGGAVKKRGADRFSTVEFKERSDNPEKDKE